MGGSIVISDVDQKSDDLYEFLTQIEVSSLSLKWVDRFSKMLILLCFIALGTFGYRVFRDLQYERFVLLDVFLDLIPFLLAVVADFITIAIRKSIENEILPAIPQVEQLAWSYLKQLTCTQLFGLLMILS